jgi:hypothetical protein
MAGRGKKKIIPEEEMKRAEQMAYYGAKNNTIARMLGWEPNLIGRRDDIVTRLRQKRAEGECDLLEKMHKSAFDKNSQVMQIWLSKNLLGMTDRPVGSPAQYLDDFLASLNAQEKEKKEQVKKPRLVLRNMK